MVTGMVCFPLSSSSAMRDWTVTRSMPFSRMRSGGGRRTFAVALEVLFPAAGNQFLAEIFLEPVCWEGYLRGEGDTCPFLLTLRVSVLVGCVCR